MRVKLIIKFFLLAFFIQLSAACIGQTAAAVSDSAFQMLSLAELQSYRIYYVQELEMLQEEKRNLVQSGIENGERLLSQNPDPEVVDEILIRLADLYYYQDKDDFFDKMEEYEDAILQDNLNADEPRLNYDRSLNTYQRIIDEFPHSPLVDDAIYNKGFLYEEMSEHSKANRIFLHLIDAYPESQYIPEAYMRLAEYYFNPPVNNVEKAVEYYQNILDHRTSPRYSEALYKLGWSYYRLSKYPEAISYFTTLIEDVEVSRRFDPEKYSARADLKNEAVEYIAVSFHDFGGTENAVAYLNGIGKPHWGADLLGKLGEIYMRQIEDYAAAIPAFQALLEYAPYFEDSPVMMKNIIDSYVFLNKNNEAFEYRHHLYTQFKPDGAWWNRVTDSIYRLQARDLSEQALRENIDALLSRAKEANTSSLYEQALALGREYLNTFPEDLNAYRIRWNIALILDTRLFRFREALEEYLIISMAYNTSRYQAFARERGLATIKDAAENAIIAGDSLVQREVKSASYEYADVTSFENKETAPLSSANSWLAMAYDNYLKLFPFEDKTATVLANAGALYYAHNQFDESLKYFKTLTRYFPDSEQIQYVQYSILETYFGKKDYNSAELLAKRIIETNAPQEMKENARRRLGESIFLKAEALASQEHNLEAAREYYRMALEVPTLEFADRAVFNAALKFETAGDTASAIRAYEHLRTTYSGSNLMIDALNNLALSYSETESYNLAAARYEDLAFLSQDLSVKQDALYNAFISYEKAENWSKTIDIGNRYSMDFPNHEDAALIYFKTGKFYLELNQPEKALQVYSAFAGRFPDSMLGTEARYNVGDYYYKQREYARAEQGFYQAYEFNESLNSRGLETNDFFAAEALFFHSNLLYERFKEIVFLLPESSKTSAVSEKQDKLRQLTDQYSKVIEFQTIRVPESLYKLGEIVEHFAHTWINQELPVFDAASKALEEKEINQRGQEILTSALNRYKQAYTILNRFEAGNNQNNSEADSLDALTSSWKEASREKISQVLFQIAELGSESIQGILSTPVPDDLDRLAELEYKNQIYIRAIRPLLEESVQAHYNHLLAADTLNINDEWTELSQERIVSYCQLLNDHYQKLAFDALAAFSYFSNEYSMIALEEQSMPQEALINSMINGLEVFWTYARASMLFAREGAAKVLDSGLSANQAAPIQNEMLAFAGSSCELISDMMQRQDSLRVKAEAFFEETGNLSFEEALSIYEDNLFFLEEKQRQILEEAWKINSQFAMRTPKTKELAIQLVKLDNAYLDLYEIQTEEMAVKSDETWLYAHEADDGWVAADVEPGVWLNPVMTPLNGLRWGAPDKLDISSETRPERIDTVYIRHSIDIPEYPVDVRISFSSDFVEQIWFNGVHSDMEPGKSEISLKNRLVEGSNELALKCIGKGPIFLEVNLIIQYISY